MIKEQKGALVSVQHAVRMTTPLTWCRKICLLGKRRFLQRIGIIMGNTMGKLYYTTPIYTPHPWVQVFTKGFASALWYTCTMVYCPTIEESLRLSILFTLLSTN